MHINPIHFYNGRFCAPLKQNNKKPAANVQIQNLKKPNYAHYVSFCGGSSLNLAQSVKNLDTLSIQKGGRAGDKFPPDVYNYAQMLIKNGNPEGNTLIDAHKMKYTLLNDCCDLADARALFDEFAGVLSDCEVSHMDDSFIAKVKNGEVENFNKDEDLALQLLKLYWAQGFSLRDLQKYCGGINLYHTIKKLNIPLLDKDYAHVLKFSDKEYNERLTREMAHKRMESLDRRVQEAQGEPVYIARGPLSDMHKKHISEGLIKYYALHPEKSVEMSARQQEYYENNPEQKELLRSAMLYAWNETQEGRSVKKYLVKFFAKNKTDIDDNVFAGDSSKMSTSQRKLLTQFWKINSWAREKFSCAVKKGWEFAKDSPKEVQSNNSNSVNEKITIHMNLLPKSYMRTMLNSISDNDSDFMPIREYLNDKHSLDEDTLGFISSYFNELVKELEAVNSPFTDFMVDVQSSTVMAIKNEIQQNALPEHLSKNKKFLNEVYFNMCDTLYGCGKTNGKLRVITGSDISKLANSISLLALLYKEPYFIDYFEQKLDECYNLFLLDEPERTAKLRKFLLLD